MRLVALPDFVAAADGNGGDWSAAVAAKEKATGEKGGKLKTHAHGRASGGFTIIELLIVVGVLIVAAAIVLPDIARQRARSSHVNCANNLKQVALAFRVWALDKNDHLPMQVSTNEGGTMELITGPNAFMHFVVMSNELSSPRILLCPNDQQRTAATNFLDGVSNSNISYFVGVDAVETNATMFLSGDRNITNGLRLRNGLLELTASRPAGWTHELHEEQGNIAFSDGSVQQLGTLRLRQALVLTGVATNRLAMP
jgi:prepilin-type processing-associated H-X9-DG protein